jgi:hypothetical protein
MGPIPYGITWRLMLLKVLHKPPRPIRIFIPKSQRGKRIITIIENNNEITWKERANKPHSKSNKHIVKAFK